MSEERPGGGVAGPGTGLPSVHMPPQTYQWNRRAVVEEPAGDAPPVELPEVPVSAPAEASWPRAHTPHVHAPWSMRMPERAQPDATYSGLATACAIALGLPFGLAVAVEGLEWRHDAGTNWILVLFLAAISTIGSVLIGLLASEVGRQRSLLRGVVAAALASVTSVLLALLVDVHPDKFGFERGGATFLVVVPVVLAFLFATRLSGLRSRV